MIITLQKLKELDVSTENIDWFKAKYDAKQVELSTLIKDLKASNELGLIWELLPMLMKNKVTRVKFAVYCAELVLTLYEQKHADGKNPRLAIEAAKAWIAKPCKKTRNDADDAVDAAIGSADAAAAIGSVNAAAYAAAWAAVYAAWAANAAYAAYSAASTASWATKEVSPELHTEVVGKIIKYGFKLIEEK